MTIETVAVIAVFILGFGLFSAYIEKTVITPPIIFVTFGLLLGPSFLGLINLNPDNQGIQVLAELTLILVLFTDASRINLKQLRRELILPLRLLGVALPLMILFGTILATWIFPQLHLWEAAALATILTPTDPALSQAVVNSPRLPICIRQTINVESGLNDGICLPILFIFLSLAEITNRPENLIFWLEFTAKQILLGPLMGIAIGYLSGWLIMQSVDNKLINQTFEKLSVLGISVLAYSAAEVIGGNGLIAAFFAGLTIGNIATSICQCLYEFGEAEGQLLILLIFLLFGATMIPPSWEQLNWQIVFYTLMSLTLIRFLAVTISFLGLKLQPITILFIGWFGPRGVASVLYGLLLLEKQAIVEQQVIFSTVMITIWTSVFAHGLTAFPAVNWYGKQMEQASENLPEMQVVSDLPVRLPWRNSQNES